MKKVVTLVCALVILCSATALADGEITFRGIPWEASMTEVEEALNLGEFSVYDDLVMNRWSGIELKFDFSHNDKYPSGWFGKSSGNELMKVAGYDAYPRVYCAYGISSENKVLRGKEDSVLYAGGYEFSLIGHDAAYHDLKSKLNTLYGEGTEKIKSKKVYYGEDEFSSEYLRIVWNGDNNTQVILYCEVYELGSPYQNRLVLWYGKSDIDTYLDKLQTLIHQEKLLEEQQNRTDSTDGL